MAKSSDPSPSPPPSSSSSSSSSSSETSCSSSSSSDEDEQQTPNNGNKEEEKSSYKQQEDSNEINTSINNKKNNITIIKRKRLIQKDRTLFKRIWSLPDEIAILSGMVEYQSTTGIPVPMTATAIGDFHETIASSLSIKVNNSQLVDKIRRLRKRYRFAITRGRNGEAPRFHKAHDQVVYDLSKRVWGGRGEGEGEEEREGRVVVRNKVEMVRRQWPMVMEAVEGTGNPVAWKAVEGMAEGRARGLEKKMRRRAVEGMKHQLQKMELMRETIKVVLEGIERSFCSI